MVDVSTHNKGVVLVKELVFLVFLTGSNMYVKFYVHLDDQVQSKNYIKNSIIFHIMIHGQPASMFYFNLI